MKNIISILAWLSLALSLQNCATIVGGSKYNAHVLIKDHPQATISYKGEFKGTGGATIQAKRKEANKFSITVAEKGCAEQTVNFSSRSFRGGAFVGTVIGWSGLLSGIPLPWGAAVDLMTGSLWKPDVNEPGVSKTDYKNYTYLINYTGCAQIDARKEPAKVQ